MTQNKFLRSIIITVFFTSLSSQAFAQFYGINTATCPVDYNTFNNVLTAVKNHDPDAIKSLSTCLKFNHRLIFQACLIDISQLGKADKIFREDENFVIRLIKVNPEALKYAAEQLRSDKSFIERATYLSRDSLQFANSQLLDNKIFMEKMIRADSRNYIFASTRIKELPEYASIAFADDGMLLMHAPESIKEDRKMVKIAMKSDIAALEYAAQSVKDDIEIRLLSQRKPAKISQENIEKFLRKNYLVEEKKRNLGFSISDKTKFFAKHRIINHKYITKWQRAFNFNGLGLEERPHLISADSRNYPSIWTQDLKKYPSLIKKIEKFLKNRRVDKDTIANLSLTYLWKIKNQPLTLAFNLYLLRETNDIELGPEYSSVTSLTAIAQQVAKNDWRLSVVETILDNEIKMEVGYEDGLKCYVLQDLYLTDKTDKNPKIIFRVADKFKEYFEIYGEQQNGKYRLLYQIDPLKKQPQGLR